MKNLMAFFLLLSLSGAQAQDSNLLVDKETNCKLRYYYFPNLQAYFDLEKTEYIYRDKGDWKRAAELPSGYMGYSLHNRMNITIKDYDEDDILQFLNVHKKMYPPSRGRRIAMN